MKSNSPYFKQCLQVLKNSSLLSGLENDSLEEMLGDYRRETWEKGANLPPERSQTHYTVIISGRLELTRINPETGRIIALYHLSTGDGFDIIPLLDGKKHDINPVALEALEIITAPIGRVRRWLQTNPAISFLPYLGNKIRALEDLSANIALYETIDRLGKLILHEATNGASGSGPDLKLPRVNTLSDEAMARMIGSVRVVVNRHIQEFTRMGLISTSHGNLVVEDLDKLRDYCEPALINQNGI